MIVHVTTEDIQKGAIGSCRFCPVALALGRQTSRSWWVDGWGAVPWATEGVGRYRYRWLPRKVQEWIANFDVGEAVEPFSFELPDPEDSP